MKVQAYRVGNIVITLGKSENNYYADIARGKTYRLYAAKTKEELFDKVEKGENMKINKAVSQTPERR